MRRLAGLVAAVVLTATGVVGAHATSPDGSGRVEPGRHGVTEVKASLTRLHAGEVPSLVRAGQGRPQPIGLSKFGVVPAGDFDTDGRSDALAMTYERLAALRGTDGSEIFERPLPERFGGAVPADVGPAASSGVILTGDLPTVTTTAPLGLATASRTGLRVEALDGAGRTSWTFDATQGRTWLLGTAGLGGEVIYVEVADLVGSSADDVVIFAADSTQVRDVLRVDRVTALVVDGSSGRAEQLVEHYPAADAVTFVSVVPDLTGDGLLDLSFRDQPQGRLATLHVTSAADGQEHFNVALPHLELTYYESVGDVTGDGTPELALNPYEVPLFPSGYRAVLLDGRSGRVLTMRPGGFYYGLGDADGDGTAEAGELHYEAVAGDPYRRALAIVVIEKDGSGHRRGLHALGSSTVGGHAAPTGDVDQDGIVDVWSVLNAYDDNNDFGSATQILSGRTGEPLWERRTGLGDYSLQPVGGSLDGDGDDLVIVGYYGAAGVDGRTGKNLWSKGAHFGGDRLTHTADLNGDRFADLVISYPGSISAIVLSGRDGQVLWGFGQ